MATQRRLPQVRRSGWRGPAIVVVCLCFAALLLIDARTRGLLANSLRLAASTSAITLPLALLLATLLVKFYLPWRRVTWGLVISGLFLPLYLVAAAWDSALGLQGWVTRWVPGMVAEPVLAGWRGAILVHTAALLPAATLLIGVGLASVERQLEEEALLVAPPWRVLCGITWRRGSGAVLAAAVWIFIVCVGEMTVTDLFQIRTFAEEIYVQTAGGAVWDLSGLPGTAAPVDEASSTSFLTGTLLLCLLFIPAIWLCLGLVDRWQRAGGNNGWRIAPQRWRRAVSFIPLAVMILVLGVPLGSLCYQAGIMAEQVDGAYVRSWSMLKALRSLIQTPSLHGRELFHTFVVCGAAACAATAVAGLFGLWAAIGRRGKLVASALAASLAAIPGPLLGLWLVRGLNQPPDSLLAFLASLYDEATFGFAPWLAQSLRVLPFALIILVPAMARTPRVLLEMAALDGARVHREVAQLLVPLHRRNFALAWLVSFVLAIGELSATILVTPPGVTPLSVRIFNLVHYGTDDQLAGLVLFVWMSVLLLTLGAFVLVNRRRTNRVERV